MKAKNASGGSLVTNNLLTAVENNTYMAQQVLNAFEPHQIQSSTRQYDTKITWYSDFSTYLSSMVEHNGDRKMLRDALSDDKKYNNANNEHKKIAKLYDTCAKQLNQSCLNANGIDSKRLNKLFGEVNTHKPFSESSSAWNQISYLKGLYSKSNDAKNGEKSEDDKTTELVKSVENLTKLVRAGLIRNLMAHPSNEHNGAYGNTMYGGSQWNRQTGGDDMSYTSSANILRARFTKIVAELKAKNLELDSSSQNEVYEFLNKLRTQEELFLNILHGMKNQQPQDKKMTITTRDLLTNMSEKSDMILQRGGKLQRHMIRGFDLIDGIAKEYSLFEHSK